jgi:cbb3-type cytochrome c oxidase subunit III
MGFDMSRLVNLVANSVGKSVVSALFATVLGIQANVASANQSALAAPKVDINKGSQIVTQVCAGCHGADGNSAAPANPKLAGQHQEYIYKQLSNFKVKPDAKTAERENAVMAGFAGALSEEDMRNVAVYFAAQKPKLSAAKNKETLELGQKIYRGGIAEKNVPACAGCHSPNGSGIPAQYPRLSGQHADYTESQLVAFRSGARKNNAQMTGVSSRLSDKEIKAVSDYIAGLH